MRSSMIIVHLDRTYELLSVYWLRERGEQRRS